MQEVASKTSQKTGGPDSSRLPRHHHRRQTSPNNWDSQKCAQELSSRHQAKPSKDIKNLNIDLRVKTYELPTIHEPTSQQQPPVGYQTDHPKPRRKTRNDRGIKALDFKSMKNFTITNLGAKSPSPSRQLLNSHRSIRGHERQQSSHHECLKHMKSKSPQKPVP